MWVYNLFTATKALPMTDLTFYNAVIPALDHRMANLAHILRAGQANAAERKIDEAVFLNARLAPDMASLIGQVQLATSLVKACPYRVTGQTPPVYEDNEQSFDDLYARIDKTRKELSGFGPDDINGREGFAFAVKLGPSMRDFTGITYASGFIMPNVLFHCTTAYNILRHNGVPLGKKDFFNT